MKALSMLFAALVALAALYGCTASNGKKDLGDEGYRSSEAQKELRDRLRYRMSDR